MGELKMPLDKCIYSIIISPFSRKLRNGEKNPKVYPFWKELILLLKNEGFYIMQTGIGDEEKFENIDEYLFDLKINDLKKEIQKCFLWISTDSFMNHFGTYCGKRGIVLWGQSNPDFFGYEENINLLKDKKYLRNNQFYIWEGVNCNDDAFVSPEEVIDVIIEEKEQFLKNLIE
jgi:hypothetical protein